MADDGDYITGVAADRAINKEARERFELTQDTSNRYITGSVALVLKGRRYIDDPSDAPEDVEVEEGPQGGYYYETGDGDGGGDGGDDGSGGSGSDRPFDVEPSDLSDDELEQQHTVLSRLETEEREAGNGESAEVVAQLREEYEEEAEERGVNLGNSGVDESDD